jgi:hypothetical protein
VGKTQIVGMVLVLAATLMAQMPGAEAQIEGER